MPIQCPVCESIQPDNNILCSTCGWDLNIIPASNPAKLKVARRAWELKKQRSTQMANSAMNQPVNQEAPISQMPDQTPQGVHPKFVNNNPRAHNLAQPDPEAFDNNVGNQQPPFNPQGMPQNPQGQPQQFPQQGQNPQFNQQGMPQNQQGQFPQQQGMPQQGQNPQFNQQGMPQNPQQFPQNNQQRPPMPPQNQPPVGRNPYGAQPPQIGPGNQPPNMPIPPQAQNAYGSPVPITNQQQPNMPFQNPNANYPPLPMADPNTGMAINNPQQQNPYNNQNNNNSYNQDAPQYPQPLLTFDEDGNPVYTSVSDDDDYEEIDFDQYTIETFERDPFETFEEFVIRIKDMGAVPVGNVKLIKSGYDIDSGRFPVEIEPEAEWFNELFPIRDELFLMLHRDLARALYQSGEEQTLAARMIVQNGTLLIDNLVVLGRNKEEYIILSKDLMKERMRKEPEGVKSVISLPSNFTNDDDDDFNDDPLAVLTGVSSPNESPSMKIPTHVNMRSVITTSANTGNKPQQRVLFGHEAQVLAVDFASHGRILASASGDKSIRFWNVFTGFELMNLKGHSDWVNCLDFSSDGRFLASGGADNLIRIWDANSGKTVGVLNGHTDWVKNVIFSPNGKVLASCGDDKLIRLWDINRMEQIKVISPPRDRQIKCIAFSPDGKTLASGGGEDKTVRLWNIQTGKEVRILPAQENWIESLAFSPDGSMLATGSYPEIKFWDVQTGYDLGTMMGHHSWVKSLEFSPNGKYLASGSCDRAVMVWDVETMDLLKTLPRPRTPEEEIVERLKPNYIPIGHEDWVNSVTFSPDGNVLASASDDKSVRLWYLPDLGL